MKYRLSTGKPKLGSKKHNKLTWVLGATIFILLLLQVIVSNTLATAGMEMSEIEKDISKFSYENGLLEEKIASASSLMTLSTKAKEIGFTKTASPIFLARDLPVALDSR